MKNTNGNTYVLTYTLLALRVRTANLQLKQKVSLLLHIIQQQISLRFVVSWIFTTKGFYFWERFDSYYLTREIRLIGLGLWNSPSSPPTYKMTFTLFRFLKNECNYYTYAICSICIFNIRTWTYMQSAFVI